MLLPRFPIFSPGKDHLAYMVVVKLKLIICLKQQAEYWHLEAM